MTLFNPLAGAILGGAQVQRHLQTDKERQVRREQALTRNIAAANDRLEHQVESAERITPVNGEDPRPHEQQTKRRPRRQPSEDHEGHPHLDVMA